MLASDLDDHLNGTARLAVMATLHGGAPVSFSQLKAATGLADGNLHVQTRRLAEAGYLQITKLAQGRRTLTTFRATEDGNVRYRHFVQLLVSVLEEGAGAILPQPPREDRDASRVW